MSKESSMGEDNMLYDTNNIDLIKLKQYNSTLKEEKNNFINKTYGVFLSSYLNISEDAYVKRMSVMLENLYKKIEIGYSSVSNYLDSYIENVSCLESFLSNDLGSSFIPESSIRNFAYSKLNDLPKMK